MKQAKEGYAERQPAHTTSMDEARERERKREKEVPLHQCWQDFRRWVLNGYKEESFVFEGDELHELSERIRVVVVGR